MGIRKYYRNQFNKPGEFHRISELFNSTLLNFTLYLAILAFSLQLMSWFSPGSSITSIITGAWSMIIGELPRHNLDIVLLSSLILIFFAALFMFLFIIFNWFIVNLIRRCKRNKNSNNEIKKIPSKSFTKLDIHLETEDSNLSNNIRELSEALLYKKNNEKE